MVQFVKFLVSKWDPGLIAVCKTNKLFCPGNRALFLSLSTFCSVAKQLLSNNEIEILPVSKYPELTQVPVQNDLDEILFL